VVLPDGTRCDCLNDTYAIEFDFGIGWEEAISRSSVNHLTIQPINESTKTN
jgi:hypothetical protein